MGHILKRYGHMNHVSPTLLTKKIFLDADKIIEIHIKRVSQLLDLSISNQ